MGFLQSLLQPKTGADFLKDMQKLTARRVAQAIKTADQEGKDPVAVLEEMRSTADQELARFMAENPRKPHMVMAAHEMVLEINRHLKNLRSPNLRS